MHSAGQMEQALDAALSSKDIEPTDVATAELARTYAREVDCGESDIHRTGPALLACLESLLLTPRARAAVLSKKGGDTGGSSPRSPLDELRERRARRDDPPAVDSASS